MVEYMGFVVGFFGFEIWFCYLLVAGIWVNYLILFFNVYKEESYKFCLLVSLLNLE